MTQPIAHPRTHSPLRTTHSPRPSFSSHTSSTSQHQPSAEELINAYEADQERIVNVLSRKLEQLSQEKVDLENAMEAENEAHVLRLQRQLAALRASQLAQGTASTSAESSEPISPIDGLEASSSLNTHALAAPAGTGELEPVPARDENSTPAPSLPAIIDALRRENDALRSRLHETEVDYIRLSRTLSSYREELLSLRRQLGLPVDNLLSSPSGSPGPMSPRSRAGSLSAGHRGWGHGSPLASASAGTGGGATGGRGRSPIPEEMALGEMDTFSPPLHPMYPHPMGRPHSLSQSSHTHAYPYQPHHQSSTNSTNSNSSASSTGTSTTPSPYASLLSSYVPHSLPSTFSPSSSPPFPVSFNHPGGQAHPAGAPPSTAGWGLTYPSVPPPSLSSSFGSNSLSSSLPGAGSFPPGAYGPGSRRGSLSGGGVLAGNHQAVGGGGGGESRGRRVVETGSLRRAGSGSGSRGPGAAVVQGASAVPAPAVAASGGERIEEESVAGEQDQAARNGAAGVREEKVDTDGQASKEGQ